MCIAARTFVLAEVLASVVLDVECHGCLAIGEIANIDLQRHVQVTRGEQTARSAHHFEIVQRIAEDLACDGRDDLAVDLQALDLGPTGELGQSLFQSDVLAPDAATKRADRNDLRHRYSSLSFITNHDSVNYNLIKRAQRADFSANCLESQSIERLQHVSALERSAWIAAVDHNREERAPGLRIACGRCGGEVPVGASRPRPGASSKVDIMSGLVSLVFVPSLLQR